MGWRVGEGGEEEEEEGEEGGERIATSSSSITTTSSPSLAVPSSSAVEVVVVVAFSTGLGTTRGFRGSGFFPVQFNSIAACMIASLWLDVAL